MSQMRTFEGTRVDLVDGMIVWRFIIGSGIYRVNSQQYWEDWPREEILGVLYRHDRRRLLEWLGQKDLWGGSHDYRAMVEIPERRVVGPKKKAGWQRAGPGRPRGRRVLSDKEKAFAKKLKLKRAFLPPYLELEADGAKPYAGFPLSDHDWIEAMFWLYSQGRSRLLA